MDNGLESRSICMKDSMSSERDANTRIFSEGEDRLVHINDTFVLNQNLCLSLKLFVSLIYRLVHYATTFHSAFSLSALVPYLVFFHFSFREDASNFSNYACRSRVQEF